MELIVYYVYLLTYFNGDQAGECWPLKHVHRNVKR